MNKITIYMGVLFGILAIFSCNSTNEKDKRDKEVKAEMEAQMASLRGEAYFKDKAIRAYLKEELEKFYTDRNYSMAWMTSNKVLPQSDSLIKALSLAYEEGLDTNNYKLDQIKVLQQEIFSKKKSKRDTLNLRKLIQLDFMMTASYLTYGSHLLAGRIDPNKLDTLWIAYPRKKDLVQHLKEAIESKKIGRSLRELSPAVAEYGRMKRQLALHRQIEHNGGWPMISKDNLPKKGATGEAVAALWKRLGLSGDLDTSKVRTAVFDDQIEAAVKKFQQRHGITPDGKINTETLVSLNQSVQSKIQLIELNMERIRWLPDSLGNTYALVNVPEYILKVFSKGKKDIDMRVIVGKEYASTPVFSDTLEYIVFNPDWTVPLSIAQKEILPVLQKNPDYLEKNNMAVYETWNEKDTAALDPYATDWSQFTPETFNYRIVQKPGPQNPLGRVKFMLPNDLFIYLHDTPNDHLFKRKERSFSHGCIRLEQPFELAKYFLNWDDEKINKQLEQEITTSVNLTKKWPVQIVYRTAWIDESGVLNFRDDIYGHDKVQLNAIINKESQLSKL
jgi:murein L,D-transpeptidase YcbB/YkuD